jgi:hypothetical protein
VEELFNFLLEGTCNLSLKLSIAQNLFFNTSHRLSRQPILQYAIFPLQFAFLYSYYPSGRMEDIAKELKERWEKTHKESAEEAFALEDEGVVRETGPSFFQKAEQPKTVLSARKD